MVKRTYHLTKKQVKELERKRRETGLAASEIVRRALDMYFKETGK